MARWELTISGKGVRATSVKKLAEKMKSEFGEGISISTKDASPPESRADRLEAAMALVGDAKMQVEELKDELQNWLDNLPENLQSGSKAEEIQTAIDELDSIYSNLDDAESNSGSVSFPGMY